jgi:hypothetical protein
LVLDHRERAVGAADDFVAVFVTEAGVEERLPWWRLPDVVDEVGRPVQSSPLDVMAVMDDGVLGRPELVLASSRRCTRFGAGNPTPEVWSSVGCRTMLASGSTHRVGGEPTG